MGRVSNAKEKLMEAVAELIWTGSFGSTTIDQICEKAEVNKGTFYYFFESKTELAIAAVDTVWQKRRLEIDAIFSPVNPPLERFRLYCKEGYRFQTEIKQKYGRVLGCPLFSLGAEIGTQDGSLQNKIQEILEVTRQYFEAAIREAHDLGMIDAPDAVAKSKLLFAYYQGLITQARIENSLEVIAGAVEGTFEILGVRHPTNQPLTHRQLPIEEIVP